GDRTGDRYLRLRRQFQFRFYFWIDSIVKTFRHVARSAGARHTESINDRCRGTGDAVVFSAINGRRIRHWIGKRDVQMINEHHQVLALVALEQSIETEVGRHTWTT